MEKIRVRYAPSPTGHLHIGNARTALFNYLFARRHGGDFIVRIEDTDERRNVETGIRSQLFYLDWLGLEWDESIDKDGGYGPYRQMERLDYYHQFAQKLVENGLAYKCYCSPEELDAEREALKEKGVSNLHYSRKCLGAPDKDAPHTIRFLVPDNTTYTFNDIVKGDVTFKSEDVGDWVILKRNKVPTYNFACAVDDHLMDITHVLRGEDHITNTPKQIMIMEALGFDVPKYGHMTLIVNEENKKLSKRDESIIQFIEQYKDLGFLPEAMFNFIALLGWSPPVDEEIIPKDKLIELFDENRLSSSPATFDKEKLFYINNRYIKTLSFDETMELCLPFIKEAGIGQGQDDDWFESLITVFKDRLSYGKQIVELYHDFFDQPFELAGEALEMLKQDGVKSLLETLKEKLEQTPDINPDILKGLIKKAGKETGMKGKMLFMPVRIAVSGAMHGPDLPQMMNLLGRTLLLKRLNKAIDMI